MSQVLTLDQLPAGYAMTSARPGEDVLVCSMEFVSSQDGDVLIDRLNGLPQQILAALPPQASIVPSQIDHLLVVIHRDKTALAYINELAILAEVQSKCSKAAGDPCYNSEIADILSVRFRGLDIPPDAGVVFVFSVGWRRGFFYDLVPLSPGGGERKYSLEGLLGQYYAYLMFQEVLGIKDDDWTALLAQRWFPFVSLSPSTVKRMLDHVRNGWNVDGLLPDIKAGVLAGLDSAVDAWRGNPVFDPHISLLEGAAARYREEDYVSSIAILYPRIEGVLRTHLLLSGKQVKPTQDNLVDFAIEAPPTARHECSPLLPGRLRQYLSEIFFAHFDPRDPKGLSRHSVSHGVAPAGEFTAKGATIGILLLEQLSYLLRPSSKPPPAE